MAVLNWIDITTEETGTEVNNKLNAFNSQVEVAANGNLANILAQQIRIEAIENTSAVVDPQVAVNTNNISGLLSRVGVLETQHPVIVTPPPPAPSTSTGKRMLQEAASEEIENAYSKSWLGGQPIVLDLGVASTTKRVSFNLDIIKSDGSQNSYTVRLVSSQVGPMIKLVDVLLEDWTSVGYDDFLIAVNSQGKLILNILTPIGSGTLQFLLSDTSVSLVN